MSFPCAKCGGPVGQECPAPYKTEPLTPLSHPERRLQPYLCPVCKGTGWVPAGFYGPVQRATTNEQCRTCAGTAVLWG